MTKPYGSCGVFDKTGATAIRTSLSANTEVQLMDRLDEQVLDAYARIFALPADQIAAALLAHWEALKQNCTKEQPCIECLREMRALEAEG